MDLAPPRGTHDLLPPAGGRMRALYDRAAAIARLYGYRYVETPGFESSELFERTSGATSDVVSKEMYSFLDRGDRSLTLRPEGTAPVMRAYLHHIHDLGSPFKTYYLTRMYRYARPQAGRLREHRQFGVEIFGEAEPSADVEVVVLGDRFLRDLGLRRYEIQINSIGDDTCRPAYREELLAFLEANRDRLRDEHKDRFRENPLRVLDCKDEACRAVAAEAPRIIDRLCEPCREHFAKVLAGLEEAGLKPVVTPTLVRGLDYYTRTAFEFVSDALAEGASAQQSTLFGGGRYDGLAEALGGPHVPGIGFGMGLERVALAIADEGLEAPEEPGLRAFVVTIGESARELGQALVGSLRSDGVSAEMPFGERPLKAQLKMADRAGAAYAAIIGEREAADGTVTLKRLHDGAQDTVPIGEAGARLGEGAA
ncbi:MAG TPA: histidine--tRNA ligase [Actinomycetota bacterium]|nr:histidine--tRNA ligase [Actinomycetota bacterium]